VVDGGHGLPGGVGALTNVNVHCSPAAARRPDGSYAVEAVTATASFRFGQSFARWFERSGARVIVGKAGLTEAAYREWFVPHGAVYLTTVGYGLGATYGRGIRRVVEVHWLEELGLAQALWVLEVERLGPFLVEGDRQGRSLFALANREINLRLQEVYRDLPGYALRRFGEASVLDEVV
jgi:L(+)-tartrate dehydratase beta subunit